MKIKSRFGQRKPVFSCEVFPPKQTSPVDSIYKTLDGLTIIRPDFISVTYGAGGSSVNQTTQEIAALIQDKYHIPAVAHLTCINSSREEISVVLEDLKGKGVENVLALRGDVNPNLVPKTDFRYASELTQFIRQNSDMGISAACYPEGHPESDSLVADILHMKEKVDAGAEHLVSQLFFDNDDFFRFLERAQLAGVNVPISAGVMPALSVNSIQRMVTLCGASMPSKITRMLSRYGDNPQALREAGTAYAIQQISDLIAGGVEGIHLYTMNNPEVACKIAESITAIRGL